MKHLIFANFFDSAFQQILGGAQCLLHFALPVKRILFGRVILRFACFIQISDIGVLFVGQIPSHFGDGNFLGLPPQFDHSMRRGMGFHYDLFLI